MYGYIYETKDNLNDKYYVGKHIASEYNKTYYGSGASLKEAIKKYGKKNFSNRIICKVDSEEDLNKKEIFYIDLYMKKYGAEKMYNMAKGGQGGNQYAYAPDEKQKFIETMTKINRERCGSEEFKEKASKRLTKLYEDPEERRKQSEKIRKSWSNEELRQKQSAHLKEYYSTHKHDYSFNYKRCSLTLGDFYKEFESVKELREFLKSEYDYSTSNPNLKKMLTDHTPFNYPRKRFQFLNGMVLSYI